MTISYPIAPIGLTHPDYMYYWDEMDKFRYIFDGGEDFIEKYLVKFSARETDSQFEDRKLITPITSFARGALIDIKNSIYQRMADISRNGGSQDYQTVIKGLSGGVDKRGGSMNQFVGNTVLPELLFMGKVGVYVDMPPIDGTTLNHVRGKIPYCYVYKREDILNWNLDYTDKTYEFTLLLLRDYYYKTNELDLPSELAWRYRLLRKVGDQVIVEFFDEESLTKSDSSKTPTSTTVLDLPRIPFILFETDQPLLRDIANHQIALMNLESSDVSYALKANYPFYTEQKNPLVSSSHLKSEENSTSGSEIEAGGNTGRAYAPGMERPGFIHPSPEPLQASMEKQKNLKDDIRTLVNLSLSNIKSRYASAESKEMDERGLESGLSALGLMLEQGEREIANIYGYYEHSDPATIAYPTKYSLKSDFQKLTEVEKLSEQRDQIPSLKFKKIISKKMATILIGMDVSAEDLQEIMEEIDAANFLTGSPKDIASDLEKGLVSMETAAVARGYDKTEIEKAKQDHAERLQRILKSQTGMASRGMDDLSANADEPKDEKLISQNADFNDKAKKLTRGEEK